MEAPSAGSLGTLSVELTAHGIELIRGMDEAVEKVEHSSAAMLKQMELLALGVVGAFAAIAAAGVNEYAKLDQAMTKSTAIMKAQNASMRKEMEDTARALAMDGTSGAEELAGAYFTLSKAGYNAAGSMEALKVADEFVIASHIDAVTATNQLTLAQSALGMMSKDTAQNIENLERISDVLTAANMRSKASVTQLAEALSSQAGPALRVAGKSLEEGVATLIAFSDQGKAGAEAGEALTLVLRNLQKSSLDNRKEFDQLGIEVFDAQGHMKDMADIVGGMENAFKGMSTEQRRAAFEMLGFQDRSLTAISSLLGTSSAIRGYEEELRKAAGTTKDVADKTLGSFIAQVTITWHRVQDLLLTIGEAFVPGLRVLNDVLKSVTDSHSALHESMKGVGDFLKDAFLAAIMTIGDALQGWKMILAGLDIYFNTMATAILTVVSTLAKAIAFVWEGVVNGIIAGVNKVIAAMNTILPQMQQLPAIEWKLKFPVKDLENWQKAFNQERVKAVTELDKLASEEKFSDTLIKKYGDLTRAVEVDNKKIEESSKEMIETLSSHTTAAENAMKELEEKRATTILKMMEMEMPGGAKEKKPGELGKSKDQRTESLLGPGLRQFEDPSVLQAKEFEKEMKLSKERLTFLESINEKELGLTKTQIALKTALLEAYHKKAHALMLAEADFVTSQFSNLFDSMATIAEAAGGKQSAAYMAMFAASKAFAIANSIVHIMSGIATAADGIWPENLAAMASVMAATASIVTTIQSTTLALSGGGATARARGGPVDPRSMFMVGERGPELFIPSQRGSIVSNETLSSGMGGKPVSVVVNNYTDAKPEVREREQNGEKSIEVLIRRVKSEVSSEIRDGRGDVTKSMESTFKLRRGR